MTNNVKKQLMIRSLRPFAINRKIQLKKSSLNDIIGNVEKALRELVRGDIEVRIELDEENPYVTADTVLMKEAVTSLVRNAIEAMPHGGTLTIRTDRVTYSDEPGYPLRPCAFGSCASFSISDTGKGMDRVTMERMFEPYFTTKRETGKGLSLAIAHSIIKEHNGCIKVESARGKGTLIKVYLPLSQGEAQRKEPFFLVDQSHGDWSAAASHEYRT